MVIGPSFRYLWAADNTRRRSKAATSKVFSYERVREIARPVADMQNVRRVIMDAFLTGAGEFCQPRLRFVKCNTVSVCETALEKTTLEDQVGEGFNLLPWSKLYDTENPHG